MPMTEADAQSSFLHARARIQKWEREFLRAWYQPVSDLMFVMKMDSYSPRTIEQARRTHPEAVKAMEIYRSKFGGE